MKRYAVYVRVSTEEQTRPGHVSLDAQYAGCHRYVSERGGIVVLTEQDVQTGHRADRSGYQRIKEAARHRQIDAVIVWKLDRFGRNFREWINAVYELEQERGITVESMSDSNDPLTRNIMMSVAEQYLRDLSRNTISGLRYRAQKGEWSGAPPIGYRVRREAEVSRLALDENASLVARLFALAATGSYSLAQLAELAKSLGLRGRSGHYLSRQALGKILRNPSYRGAVVYGRQSNGKFARRGPRPMDDWIIREDAHPAIVDAETFQAVQTALTRHRSEQGTTRGTRHLLTSFVYCGICAGTPGPSGAVRTWRMYGHGSKTPVYECSRRKMYGECSLGSIYAPKIERAVMTEVMQLFSIPETARALAASYIEAEVEQRRTAVDHQRRQLQRELNKHHEARVNLARQRLGMAGHVIPEDVYQQLERDEAMSIGIIERELLSLPVEPTSEGAMALLQVLQTVTWEDFDSDDWRRLLSLLVERVIVNSRESFVIDWQADAETLRQAVSRVSRLGSE